MTTLLSFLITLPFVYYFEVCTHIRVCENACNWSLLRYNLKLQILISCNRWCRDLLNEKHICSALSGTSHHLSSSQLFSFHPISFYSPLLLYYLISSHSISLHLVSFHHTSSYLLSFHLISFHRISYIPLQGTQAITDKYNGLANQQSFMINAAVCGICYYFYNEMQNIVLGSLGAVPTAVGNTLKRVVIFVALYFFTSGETFPMPKIIGCAIAIAGCLAFAIFDSKKW